MNVLRKFKKSFKSKVAIFEIVVNFKFIEKINNMSRDNIEREIKKVLKTTFHDESIYIWKENWENDNNIEYEMIVVGKIKYKEGEVEVLDISSYLNYTSLFQDLEKENFITEKYYFDLKNFLTYIIPELKQIT